VQTGNRQKKKKKRICLQPKRNPIMYPSSRADDKALPIHKTHVPPAAQHLEKGHPRKEKLRILLSRFSSEIVRVNICSRLKIWKSSGGWLGPTCGKRRIIKQTDMMYRHGGVDQLFSRKSDTFTTSSSNTIPYTRRLRVATSQSFCYRLTSFLKKVPESLTMGIRRSSTIRYSLSTSPAARLESSL
jgi:hypothetical protein